eukprot:jgi/Mesvir1/9085/Mv21362-RA.1
MPRPGLHGVLLLLLFCASHHGAHAQGCIDNQFGDATDIGCGGTLNYFTNESSPICFTDKPSFGQGSLQSPALLDPDIFWAANFSDEQMGCASCLDSNEGSRTDLGCTDPSRPFCLDLPESDKGNTFFANNQDHGWGFACMECTGDKESECIDNEGDVDVADYGCSDEAPLCIISQPYTANTFSTFGTSVPGICAVCHNSATGLSVDDGCTEARPMCHDKVEFYTFGAPVFLKSIEAGCYKCSDADGPSATPDLGCEDPDHPFCVGLVENSLVPGEFYGNECADCVDDKVQQRVPGTVSSGVIDLSCSADAPYCFDGNAADGSGGYGQCQAYPNADCAIMFSANGSNANIATCAKDVAIEALVDVTLENCFAYEIDLAAFASAMSLSLFPTIPRCAIELSAKLSTNVTAEDRRRRLLQTTATLSLALRVYVDDIRDAQPLEDVLVSGAFALFLAEYLEDNLGTVVSIGTVRALVLRLSSATSDPHFVTARGDMFDFNGEAGRSYCIVSDQRLQVNARFMGAASDVVLPGGGGSGKVDVRTWMDQVAVVARGDRVLVEAEAPASSNFAASLGTVAVNGVSCVHEWGACIR